MMLIQANWNQSRTFKLIPISQSCPYNEAIYDPEQKVLAVISKQMKQTYQLVPKFNDKGDVAYLKQPRDNGKQYAEERRLIDTYYEYYLDNLDDIFKFVQMFTDDVTASFAKKYLDVTPTNFMKEDQKAL